jgi:L-lactate dehydrogenase complex protein LldG
MADVAAGSPSGDARAAVLARIRAALGRPAPPGAAEEASPGDAVEIPRDYRRAGTLPPGHPDLLDLLADRLTDYRATVHRTAPGDLAATLAGVIATVVPDGGRLVAPAGLPADWAPAGSIHDAGDMTALGLDAVDAVLTACAAAAAETGTIALDGSGGQGRRALSLIPDRHICVVRAEQVVQTVPELLARLDPARPLTLISGPSATSDIELHRVEGVHGPRTLVVVLVGPEA